MQEVRYLIKEMDKAKEEFKRYRSLVNWEDFKNLTNVTNHTKTEQEKTYFNFLCRNETSKDLWKELESIDILDNTVNKTSSIFKNFNVLNDSFIDCIPCNISNISHKSYYQEKMSQIEFRFRLISESVMQKMFLKIQNTSQRSVGLSISLIKLCCIFNLPYLFNIINTIFISSEFSKAWKHVQITPIPKTKNLK